MLTTKGISLLYLNKNIILLQLIVTELPIKPQAEFKDSGMVLSNLIFILTQSSALGAVTTLIL